MTAPAWSPASFDLEAESDALPTWKPRALEETLDDAALLLGPLLGATTGVRDCVWSDSGSVAAAAVAVVAQPRHTGVGGADHHHAPAPRVALAAGWSTAPLLAKAGIASPLSNSPIARQQMRYRASHASPARPRRGRAASRPARSRHPPRAASRVPGQQRRRSCRNLLARRPSDRLNSVSRPGRGRSTRSRRPIGHQRRLTAQRIVDAGAQQRSPPGEYRNGDRD